MYGSLENWKRERFNYLQYKIWPLQSNPFKESNRHYKIVRILLEKIKSWVSVYETDLGTNWSQITYNIQEENNVSNLSNSNMTLQNDTQNKINTTNWASKFALITTEDDDTNETNQCNNHRRNQNRNFTNNQSSPYFIDLQNIDDSQIKTRKFKHLTLIDKNVVSMIYYVDNVSNTS